VIASRGMGRNTANGQHGSYVVMGMGRYSGSIIPPIPELPPVEPIPGSGGGRTDPGYGKQYDDALKETRHKRILREDDEMAALIMSMLTRGLM